MGLDSGWCSGWWLHQSHRCECIRNFKCLLCIKCVIVRTKPTVASILSVLLYAVCRIVCCFSNYTSSASLGKHNGHSGASQWNLVQGHLTLVHKITDVSTTYDLIKILFKSFHFIGVQGNNYHFLLYLKSVILLSSLLLILRESF